MVPENVKFAKILCTYIVMLAETFYENSIWSERNFTIKVKYLSIIVGFYEDATKQPKFTIKVKYSRILWECDKVTDQWNPKISIIWKRSEKNRSRQQKCKKWFVVEYNCSVFTGHNVDRRGGGGEVVVDRFMIRNIQWLFGGIYFGFGLKFGYTRLSMWSRVKFTNCSSTN